jgi:hypothetical protein
VRRALVTLILFVALPAVGQIIFLPNDSDTKEQESTKKPPPPEFRALQINRCPDAKGGIVLQDLPCKPAEPPRQAKAAAADPAPDVIELAALTPRARAEASPALLPDTQPRGLGKGLFDGSWKLGLLVLACYVLFRVGRAGYDYYLRHKPIPDEVGTRSRGRRTVR